MKPSLRSCLKIVTFGKNVEINNFKKVKKCLNTPKKVNVKGEAAVLRATSDLRPDMSSEDEVKNSI